MLKRLAQLSNSAWLLVLIALAIVIVIADQWTKGLATAHLYYAQPVRVTAFFDLTLLHNTGAAFSFLSNAGGWQRWFFTGVSLLASVGIAVWLCRLQGKERLLAFGLALVLGGAVGNLIDRLMLAYVVDFLSFHWQSRYYFPAFNLADAAITAGAIVLIVDMLLNSNKGQGDDSTR